MNIRLKPVMAVSAPIPCILPRVWRIEGIRSMFFAGHHQRRPLRSSSMELCFTGYRPGFTRSLLKGIYYPLRKLCYAAIPHSLFRLAWARQVYGAYKELTASKEKFDIIEYPECGGEGYYFSHECRVPRVIRLHTPWEMVRSLDSIHETLFDRGLLGHIERSAARCATAITSPSSALAKELKSRWDLKKITIFPNPLPLDNSTMTSGNDWIYTGRIEYRKGVHILIEAYARLCQSQTPPMLRIIGMPYGKLPNGVEYSDYIAQLITRKGCDRKIEWIRGVPLASIPGFLRRSNVAIFPSLWENLSYSCLEAMANGLTVVASRCGGFPEIINDGKNGLLFEPENVSPVDRYPVNAAPQSRIRKKPGN